MRTVKALMKNGEELGRGVDMYFTVQDARRNGHKIPTAPIAALCGGVKEHTDTDGNKWEFKETGEQDDGEE